MRSFILSGIALVTLPLLSTIPAAGKPPGDINVHSPVVSILQPAAGAKVKLNVAVQISGKANDFEDGPDCCDLSWKIDGVNAGSSSSFSHSFTQAGLRTISLTAKDSGGRKTTKTISVKVNALPTAKITHPVPNAADVLLGVPYLLQGAGDDSGDNPGQLTLPMSCNALQWSSPGEFAALSGCNTFATFKVAGAHTLQLVATDDMGQKGTAQVSFQVNKPPGGKPIVVVQNPFEGQAIEPGDLPNGLIALTAFVLDPEEQTPLTFKWTVKFGSTEKTLGTTLGLNWKIGSDVPSQCGSRKVQVCLAATDPGQNTGKGCSNFTMIYGPC